VTTLKEAAERHGSLPLWVVQAIFGILLTSGVAWVTWATASSWKHETRITVVEDHQKGMDKKLDEINGDVKELLRRTPPRR
jgi:hypothetical protein